MKATRSRPTAAAPSRRRMICKALFASVFLPIVGAAPAYAQGEWVPDRPITIYVGFNPGGSADLIARSLVAGIKNSPVPITVMNRPGAAGALAALVTAQAKPDGYSLFVGGGSETTSVGNHQKLAYDPVTSFRPVIKVARLPSVLVVRADSPYADMRSLMAAAKSKPEKLSYGSTGQGGIFHSTALVFEKMTGIKMLHVPYKGAAESRTALLAGEIDMSFGAPDEVQSMVTSGKLRPIAIFSKSRLPAFPNVPTMTELGYPVAIDNMKGLMAPAGLPDPAYKWLHDTFKNAMQSPEFLSYVKQSGLTVDYADGPAFAREIAEAYNAIGKALQQ